MTKENGGNGHRPKSDNDRSPEVKEVQPGVFDVFFSEDPNMPVISDRIAALVLTQASSESEREVLAEAICSINGRAPEECGD